MTGSRESAARLDAAIDSLLSERSGPRPATEGELTATARLLRDVLPRFHPRFGFEEVLAARLSAARRSPASAEPSEPTPIRAFMATADDPVMAGPDPAAEAHQAAAERRRRGLVAGGAIASGVSLAIPIAGAALVVWRRSRSSGGIL